MRFTPDLLQTCIATLRIVIEKRADHGDRNAATGRGSDTPDGYVFEPDTIWATLNLRCGEALLY
jgi:hypothetical protein